MTEKNCNEIKVEHAIAFNVPTSNAMLFSFFRFFKLLFSFLPRPLLRCNLYFQQLFRIISCQSFFSLSVWNVQSRSRINIFSAWLGGIRSCDERARWLDDCRFRDGDRNTNAYFKNFIEGRCEKVKVKFAVRSHAHTSTSIQLEGRDHTAESQNCLDVFTARKFGGKYLKFWRLPSTETRGYQRFFKAISR